MSDEQDDELDLKPLTPEQRQRAMDFIFSDAPADMKERLGVRPILVLDQNGETLDLIGARESGRRYAEERERKILGSMFGEYR
jgi:hypothetical protein